MSEPLDYASPRDCSEYSVSPLPTFIAYAVVYIVAGTVMFVAAPNIEAFFGNFKTELPLVTRMTLGFARWFRGIGWLLLLPVPLVVPFALARIARRDQDRKLRRWRIAGITSMVLLVLGVLMILSMWLPLVNVTLTASSPKR